MVVIKINIAGYIAIPNENGTRGRRGTAPVKEAPAMYGSEKFLFVN